MVPRIVGTTISICLLLALPITCFVHVAPSALPRQLSPAISRTKASSRSARLRASIYADDADKTAASDTEPLSASDGFSSYDWQKQWYAVAYEENIPGGKKPTAVSIFDQPFVLYRDSEGKIQCLKDLCPHRAAKLSEGQVFDGKLECLYHGWQFSGAGECVRIPQLQDGAQIPMAACVKAFPVEVREGIVYVFPGSKENAKQARIPISSFNLDDPLTAAKVIDFQVDLPYDHTYLLENLLDPAHIAISHDATPGGGDRNKAGPFDMEVMSIDVKGMKARMKDAKNDAGPWTNVDFEAPGIINYEAARPGSNFTTRIYCHPKGVARARLLFRVIIQTQNWMLKLVLGKTPLWKRHLNSNVILEQDVGLLTSQEDHFGRGDQSAEMKDVFLPIGSSDVFVVEYRKWLDKVGRGLPFYRGWASHKLPPHDPSQPALARRAERPHRRDQESRYWRHVVHCKACKGALRNFKRAKAASTVTAGLSASAALFFTAFGGILPVVGSVVSQASVVAFIASLALRWYCAKMIPRFYDNYQRHPILQ